MAEEEEKLTPNKCKVVLRSEALTNARVEIKRDSAALQKMQVVEVGDCSAKKST